MEYEERYTDREVTVAEELRDCVSYTPRVQRDDEDVILERLGQYEDLGFSPDELADILLESDQVNADRKELLIIAKKRIRQFDLENFRLLFPEKEVSYFPEEQNKSG